MTKAIKAFLFGIAVQGMVRAVPQEWKTLDFKTASASEIQALLEAGVSPNARDKDGKTPLHWTASVGFKLQGFSVTLCRHRFSFQNLVNSFTTSILPDSENRCDLPLGRVEGRRACLRSRESLLPAAFATRRCLNLVPSCVSSPPLVKPDVLFSSIRLSVGIMPSPTESFSSSTPGK